MDTLTNTGKGLLQAVACDVTTATNLFGITEYDGKCEFFGGTPPLPVRSRLICRHKQALFTWACQLQPCLAAHSWHCSLVRP